MLVEIDNKLGFALLKHVPEGTSIEQAANLLLTEMIGIESEKTFMQLTVEANERESKLSVQTNTAYEG